jgi:cytochrome P450
MSKFLSSLEDEEWKRVRAITTPTFSTGKLKSLLPIMSEAAERMLATLERSCETGAEVDLKLLFGTYTMDVIAKSAFATHPDTHFVSQASLLFTFPFWRKFLDYVFPMWLLEAFRFTVLPPAPMDFFRTVTRAAIRERTQRGIQVQDFLQLLMNAHAEETGTEVGNVLAFNGRIYASWCVCIPICSSRVEMEVA